MGRSRRAALAETLLRQVDQRTLAISDLASRRISTIRLPSARTVVDLTGPGLRQIGATAEVTLTRDYALSQAWSTALYDHPQAVDGLVYRCRHDPSQKAVALYERSGLAGAWVTESRGLLDDPEWLADTLKVYDVGLVLG